MFALEGDVLQEALREDELEIEQSEERSLTDEDGVLSNSESALMQGSKESSDVRQVGEREGSIRETEEEDIHAVAPPSPPAQGIRRRTTSRKRISTSPRHPQADLIIALDGIRPRPEDKHAEVEEKTPRDSVLTASATETLPANENIPGLAPPPAFQERFKFMICSSRLLEDRPSFDGRRSAYDDSSKEIQSESLLYPAMTLKGLGIQDLEEVEEIRGKHTTAVTEGLRRRKVPQGEVATAEARQPASFRRASSSKATAVSPSSASHSLATDSTSQSSWDFLAYSPLVRTFSTYGEPVVLFLSSLIWILDIVGLIWLELIAVSAIALCGCVNIIATVSREKRPGRPATRRRRSRAQRASSRSRARNVPDSVPINHDHRREGVEAVSQLEDAKLPIASQQSTSCQDTAISGDQQPSEGTKNTESFASVAVPIAAQKVGEQSCEPTSLQGMALETLEAVVQNAQEMDDAIANAFSIIEAADGPTSSLEGDAGQPKRLRETLHKLFATLNSRLLETYSSLGPLVSHQELQTLEAMYGITEEAQTPNFPSPRSPSFPIPLLLRSPVIIDRTRQRVSASEYSTTSTSVEGDSSYERLKTAHANTGISFKRNRARSLLSNQSVNSINSDAAIRPVLSFYGAQDGGPGGSQIDRFSPLPARSPRLSQRQTTTTLRRASSLKEKSSHGTLRNNGRLSGTEGSTGSDQDAGDGRRLRYSWRYPSTLLEESESAQSLATITNVGDGNDTIVTSPTANQMRNGSQQSIPIPRRPVGHLKELRLSQSGFGSQSQGSTPLMSSSLSPHLSLSRTPDDQQGSEEYFQPIRGPSRGTPHRLHRKRSSLQSLRYLNPDGTSVVASSPARHQRNRSSVDVSQKDLDHFIGTLPPAMVNGLRGRREDDASNRSSYMSVKTPLPARPTSLLGYASSPVYPSAHQPRLHRATSYGHLTLPALKASFLAVHLKRKRIACALLALDFDASNSMSGNPSLHKIALAKYWAQVHLLLDDLRQSLEASTAEVQNVIAPEKKTPYEPFLPGRPHDSFAPRQSDQFIMLEQIHILSRLLAGAQNELMELRSAVEQGNNAIIIQQWDQLRLDLAAMIRSWERGRAIAASSGDLSNRGTQAKSQDGLPDFVKHWDVDDEPVLDQHDADTSNEASIYSPPQAEPAAAVRVGEMDDATNHLLDSTSASFLPPPGIEDVFEALLDFPPKQSPLVGPDGQKLTREERIRLVKLARETAASTRMTNGSDVTGHPLGVTAPATVNNGQVMAELKSVISEMKKRRITAPAAQNPSGNEEGRTTL